MRLAALLVLLAGCPETPPQPTPRQAQSGTVHLPQTPDQAWADYQASGSIAPVAERDSQGRPLLYYGRVFVRSDLQLRALDFLWFSHAERPFFDEYDPTPGRPITDGYGRGNWEYAIATGGQWNVLIKYPGIVAAVQLNPRLTSAPHPMLDGLVDAGSGALNLEMLAQLGFMLPAPPQLPSRTCGAAPAGASRAALIGTAGFFDDIIGAVGDFFSDVADFVADVIKKLGGTFSDVIKAAYDGVTEAIDLLRKLGNAGVCVFAGSRSHSGIVYVQDPNTGKSFATPFGSGAGLAEPLRYARIRARGGPGGILLTTDDTDGEGRYSFDNFCGSLVYTIALQLTGPQAWFTDNGYSTEQFDLGEVHESDSFIAWTAPNEKEIGWFMGMQVGREMARANFGFTPKQAKVVTGFFADDIVGAFSHHVSITTCGQLGLAAPLLDVIDLPAGLVLGNLFNADIYMHSGAAHTAGGDGRSGIGVGAHEYGHHSMCEAIRKLGGNLDRFLNHYVITMLDAAIGGDPLEEPIRSTSESIADFSVYLAMGYTDYFGSDPVNGQSCGGWSAPERSCLEDDNRFGRTLASDPNAVVASRTSILFDWVARTVNPRPPPFAVAADHLALSTNVVSQAVAHVGSHVTTENLTAWVATSDDYGKPSEGLCRIYRDHLWSCDQIAALPVTLEAPGGFEGVATAVDTITWSWTPTSVLATSYTLVNAEGAGYSDVKTVPAGIFHVAQKLANPAPNTRVVAAVEARRDGATPARSVRLARCTLAEVPSVLDAADNGNGVFLSWTAGAATDYAISRADGGGTLVPLGVVAGSSFLDADAVPGVQYRYRLTARNCDGVESGGVEAMGSRAADDSVLLFVRDGATGGDGSRARPFSRIGDALAAVTASRRTLLVATGVYRERLAVTANGVVIYGGYSPAFDARDPQRYPSSLIGDGSNWTVDRGSGEFPNSMAPLVYAEGDQLTVDGMSFSPGSLQCSGGCLRMALAYTVHGLDLVHVHYQGSDGNQVDHANEYTGLFCGLGSTGTCRIIDSVLEEAPSATRPVYVVNGSTITLEGSTLAGGGNGVIASQRLTMDRSVVRADATAWSAVGGGIAVAATCLYITNSLIAGGQALKVLSSIAPCTSTRAVVASTLYGPSEVLSTRFLNDILIADSAVPLTFFDAGGVLTGQVVRNNVFAVLAGQSPAATAQRATHGLPDLSFSDLNNENAWFSSYANDVVQNQLASSLDQLFVDTGATPVGHVLHPLPGAPSLGAGTDPTAYGYPLTADLDGVSRSTTIFDIGSYQGSPP